MHVWVAGGRVDGHVSRGWVNGTLPHAHSPPSPVTALPVPVQPCSAFLGMKALLGSPLIGSTTASALVGAGAGAGAGAAQRATSTAAAARAVQDPTLTSMAALGLLQVGRHGSLPSLPCQPRHASACLSIAALILCLLPPLLNAVAAGGGGQRGAVRGVPGGGCGGGAPVGQHLSCQLCAAFRPRPCPSRGCPQQRAC